MKIVVVIILFGLLLLSSFSIPSLKNEDTEEIENISSQIGHLLFFDKRLSKNETKSCASCHAPQFAYTDGYRRTMNIDADLLKYNTPSILNLNNYLSLNWADPKIKTLENQVVGPLFKKHPIELGMDSNNMNVLNVISSDKKYAVLLHNFNKTQLSWNDVIKYLSSYVGKLNARQSKYDNYLLNNNQLNKDELAGKKLFFSKKLNCSSCHNGIDFNKPIENKSELYFANVGIDNNDLGLYEVTKNINDKGKFRIPSLRNVAITGPYFHNGSVTNLKEVIEIFSKGGKHLINKNTNIDQRLKPFKVNQTEIKQLISFLNTLTDTSYLTNPFFKNIN